MNKILYHTNWQNSQAKQTSKPPVKSVINHANSILFRKITTGLNWVHNERPILSKASRIVQSSWLIGNMVDTECWIVEYISEVFTVRWCCIANCVTKPWNIRLDQTCFCSPVIRSLKRHWNSSHKRICQLYYITMTITIRDGTVSRALNLRFIGREFKCCLGTIVQGLRKVQSGPEKKLHKV